MLIAHTKTKSHEIWAIVCDSCTYIKMFGSFSFCQKTTTEEKKYRQKKTSQIFNLLQLQLISTYDMFVYTIVWCVQLIIFIHSDVNKQDEISFISCKDRVLSVHCAIAKKKPSNARAIDRQRLTKDRDRSNGKKPEAILRQKWDVKNKMHMALKIIIK